MEYCTAFRPKCVLPSETGDKRGTKRMEIVKQEDRVTKGAYMGNRGEKKRKLNVCDHEL